MRVRILVVVEGVYVATDDRTEAAVVVVVKQVVNHHVEGDARPFVTGSVTLNPVYVWLCFWCASATYYTSEHY